MNIITVCDFRYAALARRLLISLGTSGTSYKLTIFCDDKSLFDPFQDLGRCEIRELPEIRSLGAKRAKFTAYVRALEDFGDFVYLDSDIIVLEDLKELRCNGKLRAAPDNLSACCFITDKRRPWPGDPNLVNNTYFNSGVLCIPQTLTGFFKKLRKLSLSDENWQRYIIPGKLYDNHFLCAHANIENIPVDPLDEEQYNWPGFLNLGQLQVIRQGERLINKRSGKSLKLAHFAGIPDVDKALCSLPVDVASLLCKRSTVHVAAPKHEFTRFQASLSDAFSQPVSDDSAKTEFEWMRLQLLTIAEANWRRDSAQQDSDPAEAESLQWPRVCCDVLWNGLQCGGACLEGDEYNYLAQLVASAGIGTAVEIGVGEPSICLRQRGVESVVLVPSRGPWLEQARAAGCRAVHVPFLWDRFEFDPEALASALKDTPDKIDLLLIDSPIATANRSRVLEQVLQMRAPRLVLFHDAHRDPQSVYRHQVDHKLRLADYLPSRRGMLLFAAGAETVHSVPRPPENTVLQKKEWSIAIKNAPARVTAGMEFALEMEVRNLGGHILSSRYRNPVHVSYHWLNDEGNPVVYDGLRTQLPFDIYPGDSAVFGVRVKAPDATGRSRLRVALVQELVAWFDADGTGSALLEFMVDGPKSPAAQVPERQTAFGKPVSAATTESILSTLHIITTDMDADSAFKRAYEKCKDYTITSMERMYSTWQAVTYVCSRGLPGDIVECGTWMGGNGMLAALALIECGDLDRRIWLYDTFEGMSRPTSEDVRHDGQSAAPIWEQHRTAREGSKWWQAPYDAVRRNMLSTGYPGDRITLVKGKVEETIPGQMPKRIAVLRLDTDWYGSTRHEMVHLFPRLVQGGVLIVDDYGWWRGSRQAVDEYLEQKRIRLLLNRIDSCGARMAVKV
ncbi:MAG: TylF/MycF/NovP-related O-methyltransferase [Rhodospirillales bacterium]